MNFSIQKTLNKSPFNYTVLIRHLQRLVATEIFLPAEALLVFGRIKSAARGAGIHFVADGSDLHLGFRAERFHPFAVNRDPTQNTTKSKRHARYTSRQASASDLRIGDLWIARRFPHVKQRITHVGWCAVSTIDDYGVMRDWQNKKQFVRTHRKEPRA
jgi:hypothetical protein